jgi:hypothetical protein
VSNAAATVHGYAVAVTWGAAILLAGAIPIGVLINADAPGHPRRSKVGLQESQAELAP